MKKENCPISKRVAGAILHKKWGQYELSDKLIVQRIVDSLELTKDDTVLEIGSGTGILTLPIRDRGVKIIAVEIDGRFAGLLQAMGVEVINGDFLKVNLKDLPPITKIVSNLPYYITTPIITKILEEKMPFQSMFLTMQKEVAKRLLAEPRTKDYGAISVLVKYYTEPEFVLDVPRRSFHPVPDVDSTLVRFRKKEQPKIDFPEEFLFKVVRIGFGTRRKMLKNNLKMFKNLDNIKVDLTRRAETLSVSEFCELAYDLWKGRQES